MTRRAAASSLRRFLRLTSAPLLVAGLTLGACSFSSGKPAPAGGPAAAEKAPEKVLVRVAALEVRPVERALETTANVESLDVVDVYPEHTEPVVAVLVEEGDRVQSGQVLARLRDQVQRLNVAEAEVRLQEARNELERAQRDHQRNETLFRESGAVSLISESALDNSQKALVSAETLHAAAKVALDRARFQLQRVEIRSPIDGVIGARGLSLGDMANPASRAFQVVMDEEPKVVFYRPQRELGLLRVGQRLTATSEALPGIVLGGVVERISPTVDTQSGTVKVTATLHGERAGLIPIGVLVRLRLVLDRRESALMVPKKAVAYQGQEVYCFVVRDGRAVRVVLRPGYEEPEALEALPVAGGAGEQSSAPFLAADDQVVTVGGDRLRDGDLVEIASE